MTRSAKHRDNIMPLSKLPPEHQARIAELVAQPNPPPKWIDLGLAQIRSRAWFEWYWARGSDPMSSRRAIPARLRELVIARDGHVCRICDEGVEPEDIHIDHIVPWVKGGQNTLDNLQVSHSWCNLRKGAKIDVD